MLRRKLKQRRPRPGTRICWHVCHRKRTLEPVARNNISGLADWRGGCDFGIAARAVVASLAAAFTFGRGRRREHAGNSPQGAATRRRPALPSRRASQTECAAIANQPGSERIGSGARTLSTSIRGGEHGLGYTKTVSTRRLRSRDRASGGKRGRRRTQQ